MFYYPERSVFSHTCLYRYSLMEEHFLYEIVFTHRHALPHHMSHEDNLVSLETGTRHTKTRDRHTSNKNSRCLTRDRHTSYKNSRCLTIDQHSPYKDSHCLTRDWHSSYKDNRLTRYYYSSYKEKHCLTKDR